MKRLLAIELQKLWRNRASKVLIISYFILLSLIAGIAAIKFNIGGIDYRIADQGIFNFPFIWHFNTYVASVLKLFLAVIIVSMMANEYTYGTLKQNLIDGLSKREFILSKFLTVVLFSLVSVVFIFLLSLILGLSFSSYTDVSIIFTEVDYLFAYFVKLLGFFSFCLFLGVLVKRSAFALGFLVLWFFIEKILYVILEFGMNLGSFADQISRFFPLESMSMLILNPTRRMALVKMMEQQAGMTNVNVYSVDYLQVVIVLAWTALFIVLSYKLLKKRDL
ncbi:MAG TPA: ABC transporter permease [Flavobacterium sp.]|nr:ABC transporter permease [Flavobacterium sp.]